MMKGVPALLPPRRVTLYIFFFIIYFFFMWHFVCLGCGICVAGWIIFVVITDSYLCQSCVVCCGNHVAVFQPTQEATDLLGIPEDVLAQSPQAGEEATLFTSTT